MIYANINYAYWIDSYRKSYACMIYACMVYADVDNRN